MHFNDPSKWNIHFDEALNLNNQAYILAEQGNAKEALELYKKAVKIKEENFGKENNQSRKGEHNRSIN